MSPVAADRNALAHFQIFAFFEFSYYHITMKEIKPEELSENPFKLIGSDWLLVVAEKEKRVNMLTASWGQVGVMWGKPVVNIFIRQSRFTKTYLDSGETFTLCVLPSEMRDVYNFCGSKSGRDFDKVKETGLSVEHDGQYPYFKESRLVFECKKLYEQIVSESAFLDKELYKKWYPTDDLHTQYIAEISKILAE